MNTNRNMQKKYKTLGHVLGKEGSGVRSKIFTSHVTLKKLLNPLSFPIYKKG